MLAEPGVQNFRTRWELVVDLLDELQNQHGISCAIAEPPAGRDLVLDQMQEQGINLRIEKELYIYVVGMSCIVEVLLEKFKTGEAPLDGLLSALAEVRSYLSAIREFLPDAYFAKYFV